MNYSATIDVPDLDKGVAFYCDALGLVELARPIPTYVLLKCGTGQIGLMQKVAGTNPAKGSDEVRHYGRHWTPVHVDFHVKDMEYVLARALKAGAKCEQKFNDGQHPPIAFCSDPFGNGFCIMGEMAGS